MKYDLIKKYCDEFGEVRTITDENGIVWYCATDVCRVMKYVNPHRTLKYWNIVPCKFNVTYNIVGQIGTRENQTMNFITREDVFKLLDHSQMPKAAEFRHWLFGDVLQTIEATGMYILPEAEEEIEEQYNKDPKAIIKFYKEAITKIRDLRELLESKEYENKSLLEENKRLENANELEYLRSLHDREFYYDLEEDYKAEIRKLNRQKNAMETRYQKRVVDLKVENEMMRVAAEVQFNLTYQKDVGKFYYVSPDYIPLMIVHEENE